MHRRRTKSQNWSTQDHRSSPTGMTLDDACLRVVDAGLWAVVFVVPLLFGGRHNLGRFVFVALCVVISLAWFIRQAILGNGTWTRSAASGIMLLALAVVGLQLVPLPAAWIESLSPRIATLLPIWSAEASQAFELGRWRTLSLAPEETRLALATLVAYALLFITTLQRVRTTADVRRMMRWIALSAIFMAGFGLLQYFSSNGRFFWFYDYPYSNTLGSATGSFSNPNHFAHFLCLGLAALVAWIAEHINASAASAPSHKTKLRPPSNSISRETLTTVVLVAGLAMVVCAVLLSYSRGAAVALAVVAAVITFVYYRSRLISSGHLLGSLGVVVLVVGVLSVHGYDQVAQRVDDFTTGSLESLDARGGRRKIWQANVEAIQAGWQTGAGAGSHRFIYPLYMPDPPEREFTHAENGPLQIVTENGLLGGTLLAWFACCCGIWCWGALGGERQSATRIYAGAITAALMASLIHSLFDFVWFVPACVAVTLIMAACALRLARLNRAKPGCEVGAGSGEIVLTRAAWIGVAALASLVGLWAVATLFGPARASLPWDRYQRLAIAERDLEAQLASLSAEDTAKSETTQYFINLAKIDELQQVVSLQPAHSAAHLRLANSYLQQFERKRSRSENQMTLSSIRDAAIASRFATAEDLRQWMVRAFGEDSQLLYRAYDHSLRSLQLCPLEGESYLFLANLCFLEGKGVATIEACVSQALAVRPYDGNVLFLAGRQQLLLGRVDEAIRSWAAAFKIAGSHQDQIIELLAGRVPASIFLQNLEPDWEKLYTVWTYYRQVGTQQDWEAIEHYARGRATIDTAHLPPKLAVRTWLRLGMMQRELGLNAEAVASLSKGNAVYPNYFHVRHHLGLALMDLEQAKAAEPHLRWCLSRRPDYGELQDALTLATKMRLGRAPAAKDRTSYLFKRKKSKIFTTETQRTQSF